MNPIDRILQHLLESEPDEPFDFSEIENNSEPDAYDVWEKKYRPIKNALVPDASFDGTMFETFGPELVVVQNTDPRHVWTYMEGDNGEDIISAGFHFVNRIGYFITELPYQNDQEWFYLNDPDEFKDDYLEP